MQDTDTFQYVLHGNEAMSGLGELAILEDASDLEHLPRLPETLQAYSAQQKDLVSKNGQWMTTSVKRFRRQGFDIRCSASCRCTCHSVIPKRILTRWMTTQSASSKLKGELGLAFRCRRLDCRMRYRWRGRIIVLHNTLLSRAIETSILIHSFRIKLRFRVQLIVSESSDIVRFARNGDFEAFRHHIRTGRATVFDVTDEGWTVLHV